MYKGSKKSSIKNLKHLLILDVFMMIVSIIMLVCVFVQCVLSLLFEGNGSAGKIGNKNLEVDELMRKLRDTPVNSEYIVDLENDNLIVNVKTVATRLRKYGLCISLSDFEAFINSDLGSSMENVDSSEKLELYTVDDFDEYLYVTYSTEDMSKFVEFAIFSDFPENFNKSVFGLEDKDTDDVSSQVEKANATSESAENYSDIELTDNVVVKSNDTYMCLTNLYDQGYLFISFTGFDNIPNVEDFTQANIETATSESSEYESDETDINILNMNKTARMLKNSIIWSKSDDKVDKLFTIADYYNVGLSSLSIGNESDIQNDGLTEDVENQDKAVFYSSKDNLIRVCDNESSKVYFRIGSVTNPNAGVNLNRIIETEYPNLYKDVNFDDASNVGYGIATLMTKQGMYVFNTSDEVASVSEVLNGIVDWLNISTDDEVIVTSDYISDELTDVMDAEEIAEIESSILN